MQTAQRSGGAKPVAFITGASYGIGAACALALARDGYDIALAATRVENLAKTVEQVRASGRRVVPVALDLNAQASIEQVFAVIPRGTKKILTSNKTISEVLLNDPAITRRIQVHEF